MAGTREWIQSYVPARLDRLPWSRWHWLIVIALGATWILDGLKSPWPDRWRHAHPAGNVRLTDAEVGASATFYLAGAVIGALIFGYLTDRLGRKKLFFVTVAVYLVATALTAISWNFASYAFFRALTGAGIGGEYAAINSAIDELIPARVRGRVDLMINGSYWIGAAIGSAATMVLLDPRYLPASLGWRLVFGIGAHARSDSDVFSPLDSGKPALVPHSRTSAGSGKNRRGSRRKQRAQALLPQRNTAHSDRTRTHTAWSEIWHTIVHRTSATLRSGFCPHVHAGVLLQRDFLHLRPGPDAFL